MKRIAAILIVGLCLFGAAISQEPQTYPYSKYFSLAPGAYFNFGSVHGTNGYGFRDSGGTLQVKNYGGAWTNINAGYSDATIRGLLSSTATGLTYTASTGVISLTSGYSIPNQALTSASSPAFVGIDLTGLTDGYVPYVGAAGLANSLLHQTGSDTILVSTYVGADSIGSNLFVGGGGQNSIGEVGATYKGSYNTSFGMAAFEDNTKGESCVAVGYVALHANTTATSCTAVGMEALNKNTIGNYNTALGMKALKENISGFANTALGVSALTNNTTGYYNLGIGMHSLVSNTTGYYNIAIGDSALYDLNITSNDGAGSNTVIGYNSGRGITTGVNNTILGANVTGLAAALSNNIILANGAGTIKAQHDGTNWMFASGSVLVGATAPVGSELFRVDGGVYIDHALTAATVNSCYSNAGTLTTIAGSETKTITITFPSALINDVVSFSFMNSASGGAGGLALLIVGQGGGGGYVRNITEIGRNAGTNIVISATAQTDNSITFTVQNTHASPGIGISYFYQGTQPLTITIA